MRIVNAGIVDRALTGFGSTGVTHTPLYRPSDTDAHAGTGADETAIRGESSVSLVRLAPGGRIARHPATVPQLLVVLSGSGWVRGAEDVWTPIVAGSAAFWERGELHETWTTTSMTVLIVEAAGRAFPRSLFGTMSDPAQRTDRQARPATRVVCVNDRREILLMRWRASSDGELWWEPPGGGIEPGEEPMTATKREWREETGLPDEMVREQYVFVHRDSWWDGIHHVADEAFFLGRSVGSPEVSTSGMSPKEIEEFVEYRWVPILELGTLPGTVEPASLAEVLCHLESLAEGYEN